MCVCVVYVCASLVAPLLLCVSLDGVCVCVCEFCPGYVWVACVVVWLYGWVCLCVFVSVLCWCVCAIV